MHLNLLRNTIMALTTLLIGTSLLFAASLSGTVSAVDGKGMATVHTSDGNEHNVKAGEGWKTGAKVECETKNNTLECRHVLSGVGDPSATTAIPFLGNTETKYFYPSGCPGYGTIPKDKRENFNTADAAKSAGYMQAPECN